MATISSHVLDSVIGTHAGGIRVECRYLAEEKSPQLVFDKIATDEGRISETIDCEPWGENPEVELIFHSAAYYESMSLPDDGYQIMERIVVRISLPDPVGKYHLPIMLSPHSYSVWWSGKPDEKTA